MKAIVVGSEAEGWPLRWQEVPEPVLRSGEVMVETHAAALNRADLLQRQGRYPPPSGESQILGLDIAGIITGLGEDVAGWRVGDRVCALVSGGGYAQRVAVPQMMLMPLADHWTHEQGAAIPEVFLTAFVNIFMEAGYQEGETVLMHGGASGVGTAAIQLVTAAGGEMLVTVGTAAKEALCRSLGAALAVNYTQEDFVQRVLEHTDGRGVDIILDIVGGDYLERNLSLLKFKGRMVHIASLGDRWGQLDLGRLMSKRLRLIGSQLRRRPLAEKAAIKDAFMARFWPLLQQGTIVPVIDSLFPVERAGEAHQRMAENRNMGKIVLQIVT
ncbi:MAG TPA: NAD(P)H-quinone oxidoreductase [Anaerolineae bacterium]|jgi:putative PIG3 family NAD(P)H quinone oxidoreductase|nr:NAD(P)H-quinone oxidoreductase [Anaerolineae bacterium]